MRSAGSGDDVKPRVRAAVVDALADRGAASIIPGNLAVTARLAGRAVAVAVAERRDEYVSLDLPAHRDPAGRRPGWKPRFHVAVDGVDRCTVTSTDNTVGALACAIDDALACVTDNQEKPCL